mmetsp:Transcript_20536/g.36922  ORF Transcript_20536/g.36922 Transcript_20536/m.36922 type:complete len:148 (-) Transcript_20536:91-534(-)
MASFICFFGLLLPAFGDATKCATGDEPCEVFNRFDRDSSGKLEVAEIQILAQALGLNPTEDEVVVKWLNSGKLDQDKSGGLELGEIHLLSKDVLKNDGDAWLKRLHSIAGHLGMGLVEMLQQYLHPQDPSFAQKLLGRARQLHVEEL